MLNVVIFVRINLKLLSHSIPVAMLCSSCRVTSTLLKSRLLSRRSSGLKIWGEGGE